MCLISVPNLKEIHSGEGCFFLAQIIVVNWCNEEENVKKIGQFSETHILQTAYLIFFKFGM